MAAEILQVGGVRLPAPVTIAENNEIIWSSDTGRVLSGKMTGDVVAEKVTLNITWQFLPASGVELIESSLVAGFFTIKYLGRELEVYRGKIAKDVLGDMGNGELWYRSVSVSLIER